jgi:hypothetical protein
VIALVVACVILIVVVLPAEYGIDPLGTGKALGLTALDQASAMPTPDKPPASDTAQAAETAEIVPVLVPSPTGDAPRVKGTFIAQPLFALAILGYAQKVWRDLQSREVL